MKAFSQFQHGCIYCILPLWSSAAHNTFLRNGWTVRAANSYGGWKKRSVVDSFKHSVELVSMFAICMSHLASWGIALHCLLTVLREHMCSCLECQSHGNTQRSPSFSFVWKAGTAYKTIGIFIKDLWDDNYWWS